VFDARAGTEEVVVVAEVEPEPWSSTGGTEPFSQEEAAEAIAGEIRRRVTQGSDVVLRRVHLVGRNWLLKTSSGKIARQANREKYLLESGPMTEDG
jgi:fatty-acyl-CoA synthase